MDRIERLLALHGDHRPVIAELERDARLARLGYPPAPAPARRPTSFEAMTRIITSEHVASLTRDGVIDPHTGERISRDEHGRTWRRDPETRRWYRLDTSGRRVYDGPDD